MKTRIDWIDSAKGIGIILVCLGHSIGLMDQPLNKMILSFHMPLFFFLSGATVKPISKSMNAWLYLVRHKTRNIMIPMLVLGIINLLPHIFFECLIDGNPIAEFNVIKYFNNWFLLSLFISVIICTSVISFAERYIYLFLIICVLFFCTIDNFPIFIIEQGIVAMIFSISGYICVKSSICLKCQGGVLAGTEIVLIPLLGILCSFNIPVGMAANLYGNKVLFLMNAALGILITVIASRSLENSRIIRDFCGKNSLIIYGTQFFCIYLIRRFFQTYCSIYVFEEFPVFFGVFILLVVVEVPIVYFWRKYALFL